jgi:phosphoribosylglycinamide formyltransferase 1
MRVAILASGTGSTFSALVDGLRSTPAEVVVLGCNVAGAGVIARAEAAGVPSVVLPHRDWPERTQYDETLANRLMAYRPDLVCLAGYMRLVSGRFLSHFPQAVLNVHPALLPSFKGLHAPKQALAAGVRVSGCTVHLVDEGMDTGPIVAQAAVPVLPSDDEHTLTARIQAEERRLFPKVVDAFARGAVKIVAGRVVLQEPLT